MKDICFVIQPFDGGKYDLRYRDIIRPAVESFGLVCYRVDEDFGVDVPVSAIEAGIPGAALVIAEITTDRPNVWFELGFAAAHRKPLILLCSDERTETLPFDIRHRTILRYKTGSLSDFTAFGRTLREFISAKYLKEKQRRPALSKEELLLLRLVSRDQGTPFEITAEERIWETASHEDGAEKLRMLIKKGFLECWQSTTDGRRYYHITEAAEQVLSEQ